LETLHIVLTFVVSLLTAAAFIPASFAKDPNAFAFVSKTGDFELYRKKSAGDTDLIAFRGIGLLAGTPVEVATGILDRVHRPEWMRDVQNLRTVRILSPGHFIEYSGVKTPFIIKNRDFVIRTDVEVDSFRTKILIMSRSVKDDGAPVTSAVRGEMTEGRFFIEPGPRPGISKITADMDVDPKGSVPLWIVNHFQKNWPIGMFFGLKTFLARGVATLPDDLRPIFALPPESVTSRAGKP